MGRIVDWLDRVLYPDHADRWDDCAFREAIAELIAPADALLDVGAGAGIVPEMNFRGLVSRVSGVDPDERVLDNAFLDEARVGTGEALPYADGTFDVAVSDNVLEHLDCPAAVFAEVARVLVPGGLWLVKTPNRRHYMPTIARLTPTWFHRYVNRLRGRDVDDTFPTLYRANTPGDLARHARRAGLELVEVRLLEGRPEYLRLAWPLYLAGWAYERLVNLLPGLQRFRIVMIGVLQKPDVVRSTLTTRVDAA